MDEVARRPTEDMRESVQNVRSVSENALGVQGADTGDVRHFLADALGTGSFSKVRGAAKCNGNPQTAGTVDQLLPLSLAQDQDLEQLEVPVLTINAFAKIFVVRQRSANVLFAIKLVERNENDMNRQLAAEVNAMKRYTDAGLCEHLVQLFDVSDMGNRIFIRMELGYNNLLSIVNANPGHMIPETQTFLWAAQLFTGLRDLHNVGFIHREIKLENLLLNANGTLKISNFCWVVEASSRPTTLAGSWETMAPEVMDQQVAQTAKVDIWSAGCTVFQLLIGRALLLNSLMQGPTGLSETDPWRATCAMAMRLLQEVSEVCPLLDSQRPPHVSARCWEFLQRTIVADPAARVTSEVALSHEWLRLGPADAGAAVTGRASPAATQQQLLPRGMMQTLEQLPGPLLGEGPHARVFRVKERHTGQLFAVKALHRPFFTSRGLDNLVVNEFAMLRRAGEVGICRHVVKLWEALEENGHVYLRLDLFEFSVASYLNVQPQGFVSECVAAVWAKQFLVGLTDLHCVGLVHRDIKPDSLYLLPDGTLKITDLGWCTEIASRPTGLAGTLEYMAPEVLELEVHTAAVDMWSAGCTLFQILVGRSFVTVTFEPGASQEEAIQQSTAQFFEQVSRVCPVKDDALPERLASNSKSLLQLLLVRQVTDRISARKTLDHDWLRDVPIPVPANAVPNCLPSSLQSELEQLEEPPLGEGAFSKIIKVKHRVTDEQFAMKVMHRRFFVDRGSEHQITEELHALQRAVDEGRTRWITKLCSATEEDGVIFFQMELCHTNLYEYMLAQPGRIVPESSVIPWSAQLFAGLADVHAMGVVHRDIKLENLLLTKEGDLKIADFGWCTKFEDAVAGGFAGTFQCMAPEVLDSRKLPHTAAVDIWSAGCSIMQLLHGMPWLEKALELGPTGLSVSDPGARFHVIASRMNSEIARCCHRLQTERPECASQPCWKFLIRVLEREAIHRPSAVEALEDQWLREAAIRFGLVGDHEMVHERFEDAVGVADEVDAFESVASEKCEPDQDDTADELDRDRQVGTDDEVHRRTLQQFPQPVVPSEITTVGQKSSDVPSFDDACQIEAQEPNVVGIATCLTEELAPRHEVVSVRSSTSNSSGPFGSWPWRLFLPLWKRLSVFGSFTCCGRKDRAIHNSVLRSVFGGMVAVEA